MKIKNFLKKKKYRVYLDYAAATPVAREVYEVMHPYFSGDFGNPSAIHAEGQIARDAVENAREEVARVLRIRATGITFTSGGTESNNLALYGLLRQLTEEGGAAFNDLEIISTEIEHPSITEVLNQLKDRGTIVRYIVLNDDGRIDVKDLEKLLSKKTALVTFAYANSEIGVVQDVKKITRIIRKFNTENNTEVISHLDASQAPLWLPCQMDMLGVDMMTLDAGKYYGPKGVGILAVRHGVAIRGIMFGGGQESNLRAGTENTPLIVGCAKAIVRAQEGWESRSNRVRLLRDSMIENLLNEIDGAILNGSRECRIANNVNISIPGLDSEYAVVTLDVKGVACSTKSACSGAGSGGSYVVQIVTKDDARANSTIRFSLGEETSMSDLQRAIDVLVEHIERVR